MLAMKRVDGNVRGRLGQSHPLPEPAEANHSKSHINLKFIHPSRSNDRKGFVCQMIVDLREYRFIIASDCPVPKSP
jgi:hypothetical protein